MAKATLTSRIKNLEDCWRGIDDWLHNGFSEKVAGIVSDVVTEQQKEEWKQEKEERQFQLDEQRMANEEKGNERDAKIKMWGLIIGGLNGGVIVTVVTVLLTRGG